MLDFILFKVELDTLMLWFFRLIFLCIGIGYVIYVLLQLRQIGIMNNTLKTRAGAPIAVIGILHLIFVIIVMLFIELVLLLQG